MVQLDIFADPICPWCWIGKTQLDRALERHGNPFTIRWHPFMLNPQMPEGGVDRVEYLESKFGGKKGVVSAYGPVVEHAESLGLPLRLDQIERTPSTIDAHRVILWAELEGVQSLVVQRIMEAYFRDGRDIGDPEVLADIADGAEMNAAVIRRLLSSDTDKDQIRARDEAAREMGVTSTPTHIVAGQHAVPGAQPEELWAKVIGELSGS